MGTMSWTAEQAAAINIRSKDAIVSAAAGSGKTAVLVNRIVQLITNETDRTPANQLVAVTFTNKAADELKARLKSAIENKLQESNNEYLREQLIRLDEARISTISSFCLQIIKENSCYLDKEGGFTVVQGNMQSILSEQAMDITMEEIYTNGSALLEWYGKIGDKGIRDAIIKMYEFLDKLPFVKKRLEEWATQFENSEAFLQSFKPNIAKEIAFIASRMVSNADIALKIARKNQALYSEKDKMSIYLEKVTAAFETIYDTCCMQRDNASECVPIAIPFASVRKPNNADTMFSISALDLESIKKITEIIKADAETISEIVLSMEHWELDTAAMKPLIQALVEGVERYRTAYTTLKNKQGVIDFSDIETLALQILVDSDGNRTAVAKELSEKFKYIIVDEFQDSNDVQYEIFKSISNSNLFFVGDIKQSIYGFNGANPQVFNAVVENKDYAVLGLNTNFRSSKTVVSTVNAIFEGLMSKTLGETEYQPLVFGSKYDSTYNSELIVMKEPQVEDYSAEESTKSDFESDSDEAEIDTKELKKIGMEALYIGKRIQDMVDEGFQVYKPSGKREPCQYSDFAVLLRSDDKRGPILRKYMAMYGVPTKGKVPKNFLDCREIHLLLNLLYVIDNPYNDIHMLEAISSPLVDFSFEEIVEIRELAGRSPLYAGIMAARNGRLYEKCYALMADLKLYGEKQRLLTLYDFICFVFESKNFTNVVAVYEDGYARLANLKLMLKYVNSFVESGGTELTSFLTYIEKTGIDGLSVATDASVDDSNAVEIMSIHSAKGLEFPICFLACCDNKFNMQDNQKDFLFDIELGIATNIIDTERYLVRESTLHKVFVAKNTRKVYSEEIRLLYVALTRAKEKLICVGNECNLYAVNYLNWIRNSAAVSDEIMKMPTVFGENPPELLEVADEESNSVCDLQELEETYKCLETPYSREALTKIPTKLTVTEVGVDREYLEKSAIEYKMFPRNPSFLKAKGFTAKARGDAYHKVMELLDFTELRIAEQIEALYNAQKLTSEEINVVKVEVIERFFSTSLGQRSIKADKICKEFPIFMQLDFETIGKPEVKSDLKPYIQGIADMFFYEGDEIVLVDYKTNERTTAEKLIEEYRMQLMLYKKAIQEMTGKNVKECYIFSFSLGQAILLEQ